jgi:hypothetical protein
MPRTITISDETYERLERLAAEQQETPGEVLAKLLGPLLFEQTSRSQLDRLFALFLRGLGLDDELIAHVLAAPEEQQARELRLALTALANEQEHRDPLKQPRYMTFEQFFRELGHTDEEIEEAKRRGAAHADL